MMQALRNGGLTNVLFDPAREHLNQTFGDDYYQVNPEFLEVGRDNYMNPEFLASIPDGSLVKVMWEGLYLLPSRDYKVVFMWRDPLEIMSSMFGAFGDRGCRAFIDQYPSMMNEAIQYCEERSDIDIHEVHFAEMTNHPHEAFCDLQKEGWPIDPQIAADSIKPELYRHRASQILLQAVI